jgi:hypothetical protein
MAIMMNENVLSFVAGIISTVSVIILFSAISDTLQSTWAQSPAVEQAQSTLPGNFTFEYNYTKYDNCTPQCQNIRVAYNSSDNNATTVNHQLQGDLVTNRVLNEQEENMLRETIMRLYEQTNPLVFR